MSAFFVLIPWIPWIAFLANLLFSVWIAWNFRLYPRPPLWAIPCLLIFGIGSIQLLFIMGKFYMFSTVFLTVLSAVFCVILALALGCRRWLGSSRPKSWVIASIFVLPIAIWADFRFRIIATDALGWPVEADAKNMEFYRPSSFSVMSTPDFIFNFLFNGGQALQTGSGITIQKGVVYFGFCQWVMSCGDLTISGTVGEPLGFKKRFEISNPKWDQWPIRVTAPLVSGH